MRDWWRLNGQFRMRSDSTVKSGQRQFCCRFRILPEPLRHPGLKAFQWYEREFGRQMDNGEAVFSQAFEDAGQGF